MVKINFSDRLIVNSIIIANSFFFILSLIITGSSMHLSFHPFSALTPSTKSLVLLGASGTIPINQYNHWWSLITANFLHGSLLHIVFNMLAFNYLGTLVSNIYGQHRMFIIYILTGFTGFFLSYIAGSDVTIGASASVCGMIGAILFYGKTRGGILGESIYRQTMALVIFIILFGIIVPNIDNWGHGGGIVSGIFLSWILGYNEKKFENKIHKTISLIFLFLTVSILLWSVYYCFYVLYF